MSLMDKLASERRARLAAERMLALKSRELFDANRKLAVQAKALSVKVAEQEVDLRAVRGEAEEFRHASDLAQENLRKAETLITAAQDRFGNAIEAVTDGIALFDASDALVMGNRAWFALFDELSDIAPGTSYTKILTLGAEEGIFDIGGMSPAEWIGRMLDRWDGEIIPDITLSLWNGRHYQISDRRVANGDRISLMVDITDRIEREEELEAARNRAETAARAKAAFLANMSHELRTPMNGVVGMADLLAESDIGSEERLYVDTIRSSGQALLNIINDVLDFSKLESAKMSLVAEPFDLERLIHEVLTLMQPTARDKDLELAFDYDLFLPTRLVGDPGRIRQVLTNLIGNAIKFTQEGHVLIRIVGVQDEASNTVQLHMAVEDTGIGIPEEKLEAVFSEFTQVENQRNRAFDGTGLGLSITRELVRLMGGEIWVQSEEGRGSNFGFRLSLPLDGAAAGMPEAIAQSLSHVLLVHSGRLEADILQRQLEQLQFQVTLCRSGSDVIREGGTPSDADLVIVDERLQDTDGPTLVQTLRETGTCVPALLLCAAPEAAARAQTAHLFAGFLNRPTRRDALIDALVRISNDTTDTAGSALLEAASPDAIQDEAQVVAGVEPHTSASAQEATDVADAPAFLSSRGRARTMAESSEQSEQAAAAAGSRDAGPAVVDDHLIEADLHPNQPQGGTFQSLRSGGQRQPSPKPAEIPSTAKAAPAPLPRMRVLAAEDNRTNQLVFRKMLKDLDIELQIVENGRAAVECFETFHPHLVFMDISMPLLDGKQATRQIRWREAEGLDKPADCPAHVPIVAMTAHAMAGDAEAILSAGLDRYLTKPLNRPDLFDAVEKARSEALAPPQPRSASSAA